MEGQRKLKHSSVLIVGVGGLGSAVGVYLAAAGVGRIGLVDCDMVELSNLQRQIVHGSRGIGKRKVESARARLVDLNPYIQIDVYNERFTYKNARRIAAEYDVLVDGTDNLATRYLSNDLCVLLKKPNVYGAVFRFEGQASVFYAAQGPCYRCLFPEPPPAGIVPTCAEGGVLGVLPGTIGTIQATETIKILLGLGSTLMGRLLLYDAQEMNFEFIRLKKDPACKVCGQAPEITDLIDYNEFCAGPGAEREKDLRQIEMEISPQELSERLQRGEPILLIDVREPHEMQISCLAGAESFPLGELATRLSELDAAQEMVVFCRTGTRSARALGILLGAGFKRVKNLQGGINAWTRDVESNLLVY